MSFRSSRAFFNFDRVFGRVSRGLFRSGIAVRATYELKVHLAEDEESGAWYVAESDIPGLWLEADDPVALIERIKAAAPELIKLNQEEIIRNCLSRDAEVDWASMRPSVRPVFDSPFSLACA